MKLFARQKPPDETSESLAQEFRALYDAHHRMVRAVLFNIVGAGPLEDLTQDTFIKVWQGRDRFRSGSSAKTWIYRVAVNSAIDHCRRNSRWKLSPLKESLPDGKDGERGSIERDLVHRGLLQLSEEHRATLVLSSLEGLSIEEVAEVLEVPEGTVRSRLHNAKKKMLEFLEREGVKL